MKNSQPLIFFGSGPVALESLRLLAQDFTFEAIITKPATHDMMRHADANAPIYSVENRRQLDELIASQNFQSRAAILIDFGIIISQAVIDACPLGIINSHFSLLPALRGADPISFAILNGEPQTGISLMLLTSGMDEGPLLAQVPFDIRSDITTPELTQALIKISYQKLREVLPGYLAGDIKPYPQAADGITYSRKLTKEDGKLDWTKPAIVLEREVRAYIDWPRSYTSLAGRDVIIKAARIADRSGTPGMVQIDGTRLLVCCGQQALEILKLQPAGKPPMTATAFLAGYKKYL